jgi:hypothetical protein
MKPCYFLLFLVFSTGIVKGQELSGSLLGTSISDAEINQSIKALLGDDFSVYLNNPGVDLQSILMEKLEREIVKTAAGASLTSPTAVAIMEAYEQVQKGKLASEIASARDVLNAESEKVLRLQQNLLKLKMQNSLSGSRMPSTSVMQTFAIQDIGSLSNSDRLLNELLSKSGTGTQLSVYDRLVIAERIKASVKAAKIKRQNQEIIEASQKRAADKIKARNAKNKLLSTNN